MMRKTAYLILLLVGLSLGACSVDTKKEVTVEDAQQAYKDVQGTYSGRVTDENVPVDVTMTLAADFTLRNLPVTPLLKRFFSGEELDEALLSAHPANFVAATVAMQILGDQVFVQMEPTDWSFEVSVGGKKYQVNALLAVTTLYSNNYKTLSAAIQVQELTCDGITADLATNGISYLIDSAIKN